VLLHDLVDYPKNDPRSANSTKESAEKSIEILKIIPEFPHDKIERVYTAILACTGPRDSKKRIEEKIARDADDLDITGACAIARACVSAGVMNRSLYDEQDPFCDYREPDGLKYTMDYLLGRIKASNGMYTKTARKIAKQRNVFLQQFIAQLERELKGA
jgi:uncharacterized protein